MVAISSSRRRQVPKDIGTALKGSTRRALSRTVLPLVFVGCALVAKRALSPSVESAQHFVLPEMLAAAVTGAEPAAGGLKALIIGATGAT